MCWASKTCYPALQGETRCKKNLFVPFSWETSRKKTWIALQRIHSFSFILAFGRSFSFDGYQSLLVWQYDWPNPYQMALCNWHVCSGMFIMWLNLQWLCHRDVSSVSAPGSLRHSLSESFPRNSSLRRPKNYFIINLAMCDIGLLLSNNSMHVIASFKTEWPFGQLGEWRRSSDSSSFSAKWLVFERRRIDL